MTTTYVAECQTCGTTATYGPQGGDLPCDCWHDTTPANCACGESKAMHALQWTAINDGTPKPLGNHAALTARCGPQTPTPQPRPPTHKTT